MHLVTWRQTCKARPGALYLARRQQGYLSSCVSKREIFHILRTMATSKPCDALSAEMCQVLSHILWHDYFTIFERLACQGICKTWRGWLRQFPLARELQIDFDNDFDHADLSIQYCVPTISVGPEEPPSKSFNACCTWLSSIVDRIQRIKLEGHEPSMWQLQQVLSIVQSTALVEQPKIELELLASTLA